MLSKKLFPLDLYVLYNGNCSLCKKAVKKIEFMDWLKRVTPLNALDRDLLAKHGLSFPEHELMQDIHVVRGTEVFRGYEGYRVIAKRLPLLWIVWPLLYIWPITYFGRKTYRHVADSRTCEIRIKSKNE